MVGDLNLAMTCLQQLGRVSETDELLEAGIKAHAKNWRLLQAAADHYLNAEHYGFIIAGTFSRGSHRGGGEAVNSAQRDRVRALQLMVQAIPLVKAEPRKTDVGDFWLAMGRMLLSNRGFSEAWRLGYLTELDQLPDYDPGLFNNSIPTGAPVDSDGKPIFYHEPKSWEAAQCDGERWRFSLAQPPKTIPHGETKSGISWPNFCTINSAFKRWPSTRRFSAGCKTATENAESEAKQDSDATGATNRPALGHWRH